MCSLLGSGVDDDRVELLLLFPVSEVELVPDGQWAVIAVTQRQQGISAGLHAKVGTVLARVRAGIAFRIENGIVRLKFGWTIRGLVVQPDDDLVLPPRRSDRVLV